MATVVGQQQCTPDALLLRTDDGRYELVNGQLVESTMGVRESRVAWLINSLIAAFAEPRQLGSGFFSDLGYRCFPFAPDQVRRPDGSFILQQRLTAELFTEGFCPIAPDLAIEVVSPNDPYREVEGKVDEYLRAGVRLVWVINPERELIRIHRADGSVSEVRGTGELSGEDVLPGFSTPVARLFQLPPNLPQA